MLVHRKKSLNLISRKEKKVEHQPPMYTSSVLNFNKVGMKHFYTFHQEPHSKKNFRQWINSMALVMNQILEAQITKPEVEEEKTNEPEETHETTMVLW